MKRIGLIALMAAGLCLLLSACSFSVNDINIVNGVYKYDHADEYLAGGTSLPAAECASVDSIRVGWVRGNVEIVTEEGEGAVIAFEESSDKEISEDYALRYVIKDGLLDIRFCKNGVSVGKSNQDKKLILRLPASMEVKTLDVNLASAKVTTAPLSVEEMTLNTASGAASLSLKACRELIINTASGAVTATVDGGLSRLKASGASGRMDLTVGGDLTAADLNTASGAVTLTVSGEIGTVDSDSASGDLTLTAAGLHKLNADSASGKVRVTASAFDQLDVDTASGAVTLTLPSLPGFTMKYTTASGKLDSDVEMKQTGKTYVCGDGSGRISVNTASGDLILRKNG